jgi:cytoskeletal protein CcmA (bactofilin family)
MLFFSGAFWKGWDAMRSLTEFLAVATLGMLVIWLFRRHLRRAATLAVVMGALVLALAFAPAGQAADVKHGNPGYTLAAGEVVHTDLIVSADSTRIDGDVEGDLITFSRSVTVNGHIKGDVIAFSQELRVNGPVDGNVRAFVQTMQISSAVTRNVMAWVGDVNLEEKAKVNGTMTLFAGNAELNGEVAGDLLAFMGDMQINGLLGRNAWIHAGHLSLGPRAEIKGQTKFEGRHEPEVATTAKLGSPIDVTILKHRSDMSYSSPGFYWHQILLWGASFVFGLAMLLLTPGFFLDATGACKRTVPAIGFGALFLFAIPILAVIICITIVGIGVGVATLMFWAIAIYAAHVIVGAWLGDRLLGETVGVGPALGRMALGILILRAIGLVPYLGFCFSLLVLWLGLGAIVLAIYRNTRPHLAASAGL